MQNTGEPITLVKDAIHNPDEPRHFMRIARPQYPIVATAHGLELARSTRALKLKEVGRDVYDAIVYFPRSDVVMERLERTDKTTHCPLKGDTEYFDVLTDGGTIANAAWSYDRTLPFAREIAHYIAFDPHQVNVLEYTAGLPGRVRAGTG